VARAANKTFNRTERKLLVNSTLDAAGMTRRRKIVWAVVALLALPIIVLGLFVLNGTVVCDGTTPRSGTVQAIPAPARAQPDELRVMAFNIAKCFVYKGGSTFAERNTVEGRLKDISQIIRSANPDVVCLSEIVRECGPCEVDHVRFLAEQTGLTNWAFGECFSFGLPLYRVVSGNAIISRYPLQPSANASLVGRKPFYITKNNRRALACTVASPEGDMTERSLHNDSFNLSNNLAQVQQLLAHPLTVDCFMAGDFNARPSDASMALIQRSARFTRVFDGPNTFPATNPTLTIDYVIAPTTWTVREHRVIANTVSDHCAVLTVFTRE